MGDQTDAALGPDFGARLRRLREAASLTQDELAQRAGLTAKAISLLERGERRHPYPHTVRSLADALGLAEDEPAALLTAVPPRPRATPTVPVDPAAARLPLPPTPLVGREQSLEEVRGLLGATEVRVLTLLGTGGVGKARLALEVARGAGERFPDGVAFVALAPLRDPQLVIPTAARALGLRKAEGRSSLETLKSHLREKSFLLILHNLEHVLEAAPEIADLMEDCPELTVLATSRAPLRVRGEHEYSVSPLALPVSTPDSTVAEVLTSPAGSLFAERAHDATPGFRVTPGNAPAVAAICRRLAGLPLALELAAAEARFLDPKSMLPRLDRALSEGWTRDLPERQRTMRATLDWSYELLPEEERAPFRRLSVFAGGFELEAAEAVGSEEAFVPLGVLVEQSLVVIGEAGRYNMLEPVKQYALERLKGPRRSPRRAVFWQTRGLLAEGREWLERALSLEDARTAAPSVVAARANALIGVG